MKRIVAGIIALVAWFAIVLQFVLVLVGPENQSMSFADKVVTFLSYFTVWTNIVVAVTTTAIAFLSETSVGRFFAKASTQAAVAVYILVVGIIYSLFLRGMQNLEGWRAVADHLLHDVVPLIFVVYWLTIAPKQEIAWTDPLKWLVYPLAYVIYSLARGAVVSWYPYWFVDVTKLGYPTALTNTAFVLGFFLLLGLIFVLIARLFSRTNAEVQAAAD